MCLAPAGHRLCRLQAHQRLQRYAAVTSEEQACWLRCTKMHLLYLNNAATDPKQSCHKACQGADEGIENSGALVPFHLAVQLVKMEVLLQGPISGHKEVANACSDGQDGWNNGQHGQPVLPGPARHIALAQIRCNHTCDMHSSDLRVCASPHSLHRVHESAEPPQLFACWPDAWMCVGKYMGQEHIIAQA